MIASIFLFFAEHPHIGYTLIAAYVFGLVYMPFELHPPLGAWGARVIDQYGRRIVIGFYVVAFALMVFALAIR